VQEGYPAVECEVSFYNLTNKMKLEQNQSNIPLVLDQKSNPQDTDVMVEVLVASSGKIIQNASKLASEGKIEEAHDQIKKLISRIDNYKHHSPTSLGEIAYRLKNLDEKLGEKNANASKHLLAEGTNLSFRGIDKLDLKDVKSHNEIFYIETEGEIDLYKCPEIRSNVESQLLLGYRYIIIDMNNTRHIDSSAIGTLIQIVGWLRRRGGELVVVGVKDNVKKIFEITKLFSHIRTFASREEAKDWIKSKILSKESDN
jgi:Ca-activated chloride channel family protein